MLVVVGTRTSSKSVWCYNDDLTLRWSYDTGGNANKCITDVAGNVYVVGNAANNSDGNGTRNCWKLNSSGGYIIGAYINSAAIAYDIDVDSDYVYVATSTASVRLTTSLTSPTNIIAALGVGIKVDSSGNIYISSGGDPYNLYKYNSSLVQQWYKDPQTSVTAWSIDLLSNEDVIVSIDHDIYYYKADGTSPTGGDWSYEFGGGGTRSRIAIDSADNIYAARSNDAIGSEERFVCLDSSGVRQWGITTASGDLEDVVIDEDDVPYVCGDRISNYTIWQVDVAGQSLTDLIDSGGNLLGIAGEGVAPISPPVDKQYSKKLVAIGNGQVWYESTAGTMSYLSNSVVETSNLLTAASAFEKVFIANETNLKVADFGNTKIVTTDLNTNAPDRGNILTGGTSGAKMVVDYITSVTADAACTIYGKRTTVATFASGETVTGTDDDGNSISFVLSANETAPPHWYDWTVYGNDTANFGTMPASANLVCLYRGRLVLSGNSNYPHQWYMSKVANPFDWVYSSTDPLTAVAGNNIDAGEIGDIIEALIPYGDDFLVFGAAESIHLLDGDPAFGGSIDELSEITGIYGFRAWCKDENGNLYFWGTNGLYKMEGGRSKPINISQGQLPKWADDWTTAPATHRIVLTYDPSRNGIIVSKTTLADGTNLNYWYDLKTEGFYPEDYPAACGIFSSYYYDSDASGTRELILGCNDGYLRSFYDTAKDDDSGDSDTAISSYVTLPIIKLTETENSEGKLTSLVLELAGGASTGSFSDTDQVSYELHKGDDAETVLEDIKDAATAQESGTLTGTGRKNRIRKRVRGRWLGIKLYESTASKTWAINSISGEIKPAGNR